jgi:hypothetical protein
MTDLGWVDEQGHGIDPSFKSTAQVQVVGALTLENTASVPTIPAPRTTTVAARRPTSVRDVTGARIP